MSSAAGTNSLTVANRYAAVAHFILEPENMPLLSIMMNGLEKQHQQVRMDFQNTCSGNLGNVKDQAANKCHLVLLNQRSN